MTGQGPYRVPPNPAASENNAIAASESYNSLAEGQPFAVVRRGAVLGRLLFGPQWPREVLRRDALVELPD
jgi:hypothetical protein